jgi:hypothetical protein
MWLGIFETDLFKGVVGFWVLFFLFFTGGGVVAIALLLYFKGRSTEEGMLVVGVWGCCGGAPESDFILLFLFILVDFQVVLFEVSNWFPDFAVVIKVADEVVCFAM